MGNLGFMKLFLIFYKTLLEFERSSIQVNKEIEMQSYNELLVSMFYGSNKIRSKGVLIIQVLIFTFKVNGCITTRLLFLLI